MKTLSKSKETEIVNERKQDCQDHYEFAKKTMDSWPTWKKEIGEELIRRVSKR